MMKNIFVLATIAMIMMTGCSKTWSGMQQDTHEVIEDTKGVIHEATIPTER